jgi:plasmid maintenance system antidote protein VapI
MMAMAERKTVLGPAGKRLRSLAEGALTTGYQTAIMDAMVEVVQELERRGMTRKELADRLEVHPSYVSRILNDPDNMTVRTLFRVCSALDLAVTVTVGERQAKKERPAKSKARRPRTSQLVPAK